MREEQGYWQKQTSRRRLLRAAALGGTALAAVTAFGCRREEQLAATSAVKQPKRGGTLRHPAYIDLSGQGFDPHVVSFPNAEPFSLYYQGLVGYIGATFEVKPELAQRWEQPSPTQLVFTLQPGVKWHNKPPANGRDLTVEDVVFSLERIRSDDPRFQHRGLLDTVDKIEAPDRATIRFTLKEPDAGILPKLSPPGMFILARDVVEKVAGRFASAETVVGTGPFIMTFYEERVRADYVRNPDYWKPGLPYLDRIIEGFFSDPQTQWAAFLAGELDATPVPGSEAKRFMERQAAGYTLAWYQNFSYTLIQANVTKPPMNDRRIPKALRLLVNHEEFIKSIAEVYQGQARYGFVLPTCSSRWDLTHEEYTNLLEWKQPKDEAIREALALLRAAGYTREHPLEFELTGGGAGFSPQIRPSSELLHAQWNQLSQGVLVVKLQLPDLATQNRIRSRGEFTALLGGTTGWSDPDVTLSVQIGTGGSRNYTGFSDAKADELIRKQRHTLNTAERQALIREIILYLNDVYPGTAAYLASNLSAARPLVQGYGPESGFDGRLYETVWLDV